MKYTWLLFDADDTLFDFSKAESNALKWTLEQSGLPFRQEFIQHYAGFNQQVWQEFEQGRLTSQELRVKRFKLFLENADLQGDIHLISQIYLRNLGLGTDLLDGANDLIHNLKQRYRVALVTNGLKDVQDPRLQGSTLRDCFEHVFISEVIGAAKPTRQFFEAVFDILHQPAREEVLIIGDSLSSDIKGGIDFGIDTCWYNPRGKSTNLAVTYQITRLRELLDILD
ncbi:MAG: YjjG family noncanonical pyrimidine nucleotidase [Chloroflexi bacterium]|nr:YjjG family noncanonical pyrimidine nucleotidase [Chloroflexota bacterium]